MAAVLEITPNLRLRVTQQDIEQKNEDLAKQWAKERVQQQSNLGASMLEHYSAAVMRIDDPQAELTDELYDSAEVVLQNLLTDLMHFADEVEIDFLDIQARARMDYDAMCEGTRAV